jgi:2-aminoethylphosphonate-pyruvate transaminase
VIYPGKVTDADTFRIGNIGNLFPADMRHLIQCIGQVLQEMGVQTPVTY